MDRAEAEIESGRSVAEQVQNAAPWIGEEEVRDAIEAFSVRCSEAQLRWLGGLLAMIIGRGGIGAAAEALRLHPDTVSRGKKELKGGLADCPFGRSRKPGAGRLPIEVAQPGIMKALKELAKPYLYGDPETGEVYCRRSTRELAADLREAGYSVSYETVHQLLKRGAIHSGLTSSGSPARRTRNAKSNSR